MLINGVFSGGGLKGYALVGSLEVLEQKGYRFNRLIGTSAGAILASFIAVGYTAEEIEEMLDELDPTIFLDARKTLIQGSVFKWVQLYFRLGLYKGQELENWFMEKLMAKNVYCFGDLPAGKLQLIASDLTNKRMLVLPDDLEDYGINQDRFPIAKALRMSCSIPYFFEPVKIKDKKGANVIVDGGILSNFPMWYFEEQKAVKVPTLGVKLSSSSEEKKRQPIKNAIQLFESLFSTMKDAHDDRYISRDYEKNVIFLPVESYSATDFHMDEETKQALLQIGRLQTEKFLKFW